MNIWLFLIIVAFLIYYGFRHYFQSRENRTAMETRAKAVESFGGKIIMIATGAPPSWAPGVREGQETAVINLLKLGLASVSDHVKEGKENEAHTESREPESASGDVKTEK